MRRATALLLLVVLTFAGTTAPAGSVPRADRPAPTTTLRVQVVTAGLSYPWDVQELPTGQLLVTERNSGRLSVVTDGVAAQTTFPSGSVWWAHETGLMSVVRAPDHATSKRIVVCQSFQAGDVRDVRVVSYVLDGTTVSDGRVLLAGLPFFEGRHAGCRLLVDQAGSLLVGTGDTQRSGLSRDLDSLGGKVLRLDPATGAPWPTNPWVGSPDLRRYVLTYGHRNVQGLAQRADGTLWSVEHGSFRDDEVNLLRAGGDYGWDPPPPYDETVPMTDHALPGTQLDARWSSGTPTIATSGAAWVRGKAWGQLDGTLAVAALNGQRVVFMKFNAKGQLSSTRTPPELQSFGRLRSITRAADGSLLVTTSNGTDDKILRVTPG